MRFLSKTHSEIAQRLGCVSESDIFYDKHGIMQSDTEWMGTRKDGDVEAFIESDFTGSTEQARKNAELVWPKLYVCNHCGRPPKDDSICRPDMPRLRHEFVVKESNWARHQIIDSEDGIKIIEQALEKHEI